MTIANDQHEANEGEAPIWHWPLYALLALIASLFNQITKLKRARSTTKFKPNWRDHWADLRQCEWLRDQVIAHGLASLLAGRDLDLNPTLIMDPPDTYGARCPRTPFAMNQRFLALARWTTNPEAIIRERYKRLVKRFGANPLAAHGSTGALRAAHHEAVGVATSKADACPTLMVSSAHRARPSNHEGVLAHARAPPAIPRIPASNPLPPRRSLRPGSPPHARITALSANDGRPPHLPRILRRRRHGACRPVEPFRLRLRQRSRPDEVRRLPRQLP